MPDLICQPLHHHCIQEALSWHEACCSLIINNFFPYLHGVAHQLEPPVLTWALHITLALGKSAPAHLFHDCVQQSVQKLHCSLSFSLSLCQISHLHRFAIWATCTSTLHPLHSCPHFLFINTLHFLDHQPSSITPPPPLSHFSSFSSKYPIQPLQHTTFTRRHISTSILNPNLLHILSSSM